MVQSSAATASGSDTAYHRSTIDLDQWAFDPALRPRSVSLTMAFSTETVSSRAFGFTTDGSSASVALGRLMESAERIHLDPKLSIDEIEDLTRQTVAANNLQDGYIRLILSNGEGTLGLNPFSCPNQV